MTSAISWIKPDETAKEALVRILTDRPFVVLPPPLHRLPLRVGNVVEIVGPSPSAKTLILTQAVVNCILPKEWKGVQYGGLERAVLFVDLDCRFDVLSLSRALELRITGGSTKGNKHEYDKELFAACMRRFLYIRCYNSFEFLSILKTMHYRLQNERETQATGVYMLMFDSIGAFYWMDRALPSSSSGNNRKNLSLQSVAETTVQEIQRLLLVHPMLVLVAKSASFSDKQSISEVTRNSGKRQNTFDIRGPGNLTYRDYMPSVWQSFVTHRVLFRASGWSHSYSMNLICTSIMESGPEWVSTDCLQFLISGVIEEYCFSKRIEVLNTVINKMQSRDLSIQAAKEHPQLQIGWVWFGSGLMGSVNKEIADGKKIDRIKARLRKVVV